MKVVLLPGWHENSQVMRTFIDGRHGVDGLAAYGFDCSIFPGGHDALRARIDRFAQYLEGLKRREPDAFPVATIGYSAGGLVNLGAVFDVVALLGRGFRADDRIWHRVVQIAARFLRGEPVA